MKKFIDQCAEYILKKHEHELYKVAIFVPNNRLAIYFNRSLLNQSSKTLLAPQVESFSKYLFSKSNFALGSELLHTQYLFETYVKMGGELEYNEFLPSARTMLADFDELDEALVNTKQFFKDLKNLKSLNTFLNNDSENPDSYSKNYALFWSMFEESYYSTRQYFNENNRLTKGMIARNLAEDLSWMNQIKFSHTYFIGFTGLLRYEEKIIENWQIGDIQFINDVDEYYILKKSQEAGYFFRMYENKFGKNLNGFSKNILTNKEININNIQCSGMYTQCKVVMHECEKIKKKNGNLDNTAVILADKHFLKPLLNIIPKEFGTINISMGFPLSDAHLGSFLEMLIKLQDETNPLNKPGYIFYKPLLYILKHPYIPLLHQDMTVLEDFEHSISDSNLRFISLDKLYNLVHPALFNLLHLEKNPAVYINNLDLILIQLFDLFKELEEKKANVTFFDSPEFIFEFRKNLRQLLQLEGTSLTMKMVIELVTDYIKNHSINFEGSKQEGLQILGLMESRGLDFENVFILGMNEGKIPASKHQKTFIPFDLRINKLNTRREKDSITAYLFYRLLHYAKNIWLLYGNENKDLGGGEKSRFIQQLEMEYLPSNSNATFQNYLYSTGVILPAENEITIPKNEEVFSVLTNYLSEKGISPTAISTYIDCKLKFYLSYVERYKESDIVSDHIEDDLLGNAVHYVFEELYKPFVNHILKTSDIENMIKNNSELERLIKVKFLEKFTEEDLNQGRNLIIQRVAMKMITTFLQSELELLKQKNEVIITGLEKWLNRKISINNFTIKLNGKADRIDRINGVERFVDYKTGSVKDTSVTVKSMHELAEKKDKAKSVQLFLYAWMNNSEREVISEIIGLKKPKQKYVLKYGDLNTISQSILQQFEEQFLSVILYEITNKEIPFTQTNDEKSCSYCSFKLLCGR